MADNSPESKAHVNSPLSRRTKSQRAQIKTEHEAKHSQEKIREVWNPGLESVKGPGTLSLCFWWKDGGKVGNHSILVQRGG